MLGATALDAATLPGRHPRIGKNLPVNPKTRRLTEFSHGAG
jgi:hypothetical protein